MQEADRTSDRPRHALGKPRGKKLLAGCIAQGPGAEGNRYAPYEWGCLSPQSRPTTARRRKCGVSSTRESGSVGSRRQRRPAYGIIDQFPYRRMGESPYRRVGIGRSLSPKSRRVAQRWAHRKHGRARVGLQAERPTLRSYVASRRILMDDSLHTPRQAVSSATC